MQTQFGPLCTRSSRFQHSQKQGPLCHERYPKWSGKVCPQRAKLAGLNLPQGISQCVHTVRRMRPTERTHRAHTVHPAKLIRETGNMRITTACQKCTKSQRAIVPTVTHRAHTVSTQWSHIGYICCNWATGLDCATGPFWLLYQPDLQIGQQSTC